MMHFNSRATSCRMDRRIPLAVMSAAAVVVFGCTSTPEEGAAPKADPKPPVASSAPGAEPSYPYSRKEEFAAFMKSNLDKLNQEIDLLSAKIASLSAAAQTEAMQKLKDLREQAQRLGQQFDKVQNASAGSWEDVKTDVSKAYADLQTGIRHARQWLSEKIAP